MRVRWSDEAVHALVALEISLGARYSAERAAAIVEEIIHRTDTLGSPS
jgi:hypothetical protein